MLLALALHPIPPSPGTGCQKASTKGKDYTGRAAVTQGGLQCKVWSKTSYPDQKGNYCRNPSSGRGVWCYTKDPGAGVRWDYCDVPECYPGQALMNCAVLFNFW